MNQIPEEIKWQELPDELAEQATDIITELNPYKHSTIANYDIFNKGAALGLCIGYSLAHRWIPVTERLPEVGERVLCFTEYGSFFVGWLNVKNKWKGHILTTSVTHWLPLPPFP